MRIPAFLVAAGTLVAGPTLAADLPPAPEPVDYVRVCDSFGSGFFYIPGTESCLRLRGRMRTEIRYRHQAEGEPIALTARGGVRGDSPLFMRARGYWGWDHRTATDIGIVRAFFRGFMDFDTGDADGTPSLQLDYAFIQIGGVTVGFSDLVIEPVFDGYVAEVDFTTGGFENEHLILQYEYAFGNGLSLGLVLFDATNGSFGTPFQVTGTAFPGVPFVPVAFGGQRLPAGGAALTYDGSFGSVRLAGVVQDIGPAAATAPDHGFGWGIGLSADLAVPFGTDTRFGFNAQYADGALYFLHEEVTFFPVSDFTVNAADGSIDTSRGWSVTAGLSTEVADKTTLVLAAGYTDINQSNGVADVAFVDVQANLRYQLTDNLVIIAAGEWREAYVSGLADSDGLSGILRAQLDF